MKTLFKVGDRVEFAFNRYNWQDYAKKIADIKVYGKVAKVCKSENYSVDVFNTDTNKPYYSFYTSDRCTWNFHGCELELSISPPLPGDIDYNDMLPESIVVSLG
jgi:hypothetical protein